jgi:hypothetical protein
MLKVQKVTELRAFTVFAYDNNCLYWIENKLFLFILFIIYDHCPNCVLLSQVALALAYFSLL